MQLAELQGVVTALLKTVTTPAPSQAKEVHMLPSVVLRVPAAPIA